MGVADALKPRPPLTMAENNRSEKGKEAPILHVLVVGFHHHKGCVVEYVYPPLSTSLEEEEDDEASTALASLTSQLPPEWRHLPHLALPDGCHNYEEDASFFVLRAPDSAAQSSASNSSSSGNNNSSSTFYNRAVYGVACCRQIDSKDVMPSTDITRSTVQKSLCVLSRYPLFGRIEAKLSQITQAYFQAGDFSDVSLLRDAFASLKSSFQLPEKKIPVASISSSSSSSDAFQVGLSQQALVLKFGHRLLQLFKALLLNKRVMVCGSPTRDMCNTVLAVASLFPKSLESLAVVTNPDDRLPTDDDCGFPLRVFPSPFSIQPYLCLQQMDSLTQQEEGAYRLVGVSNPLFQKAHTRFCDVYVGTETEDCAFRVADPELRATLYLTAADLRFCDFVVKSVSDVMSSSTPQQQHGRQGGGGVGVGWFGSDGWVQSQFKLYLLSLLSTSLGNQRERVQEFGPDFMEKWLKCPVYANWKLSHKKHATTAAGDPLAKVEPAHLCQGNMTFGDLKLRLSARATEYGVSDRSKEMVGQVLWQTQQAIGNVGGAVGGAWNAATSALSTWWSGSSEDD